MAITTGDPLGHPGFVRGEEEEVVVVGEERYGSDSDDDDDDVDRYEFLAREPAAAEARDEDDAIPGGGRGGGKRLLREVVADAPPAAKKARLGLAAPRGGSPEEPGNEEPVRSPERFPGGLDQGKKNKRRRRCGGEPQVERAARGKRSRVADSEASQGPQHWHVMAAAAAGAGAGAAAPRRFPCSICGRCFGSYQALGGHVHLGHMKKAKDAIAAASHGDVAGGGNGGDRDMKVAMVESADGSAAHGEEKAAVAADSRQDVDSSSGDSNSNDEEMFIRAAEQGDHRGDGKVEGEKVTAATRHDDEDGNGTERKAAVGRCHELAAIGNGSSVVRKTQYGCRVCGKEYLSGKALGGHMRMHRKLPPHDGGKERRSPEVADGAVHGEEKTALAASSGESDGDGKKTLGAAARHQDVDSSSSDSNSNEEMFMDAADRGDHRGNGNVEVEKVTVATSDDGAHGNGNGTERKVAGIDNVNSIVRKTQYRCRVCGQEYLSGKALGGHMRKHRKLPPHDGGKERRSPEVADGAGESGDHGKKGLDAVACHQGVDSSSGEEEMFIGAAIHGGANGDGDSTERKAIVGGCHELATAGAIGNASSTVRKTQYRCEVCGKECFSGQALGGHMRKHRKRSPDDDGGKERTSPEAGGVPNRRAAVITGNSQLSKTTNSQYGSHFDGSLIGWL